jgi:CheY-like chemotaxis protein
VIKESGVAMAFRVFFVDDGQENRMIIGEILEFNQVDHTMAENGQQQ